MAEKKTKGITGLKGQMNIVFFGGYFHLNMKGIPFALSRSELQFLIDMSNIMIRDFGEEANQ